MEKVYRLNFSAWLFTLMAAVVTATSKQPPMITKFVPKDLVKPNDVTRMTGFKLPCEASGTNLTWTWRHNDIEITNFNGIPYSLSEDGTLTGEFLASKHEGTYQCFVKDEETGVEVFSRKLKVAVTVVGDFIDKNDVVKKVDLGQSFQFRCPQHTAGFGAFFSWLQNKWDTHFSRDERRGISPDGTFFITYVTQEDINDIEESQGIKCRMTAGNSYQNSGTLKLEKNNPEQSDPNRDILPTWAEVPAEDEIAIEGKSKTLYCMAYGNPAPNITWKKNGRQIVPGQNSFEIPSHYYGRLLTITNVNKTTHQDVYTCEAANSLSNGQPLTHTINLEVNVPPRWTNGLPPRKIDVIIGRNETIDCKVTADPEATITWYENGKPLQSSSDHLIVDGSKLHLRDVNLTNDGVYQCAAENNYGMIVSATWVYVKAWKPFFGQFGPFSLLHGGEGELHCKPSAEPRPTFQWFRNGVLISDGVNSRYQLKQDGTLVIKKVDKDKDSVNYTCKAQNMMGEDSATTVPIVLVLPSFVKKPRNQTVIEKETAIFYCNASGNPTPSITWLKDGTAVGTGNTLRFDTTWRYQSGRYWCKAQNGLNVTVKTSAYLHVQFLPYFTRRPTDYSVMEGHEALFYCNASGNPSPTITWLRDGKFVGTGEALKFVAFKNHSGNYWCSADNGLGLPISISAYLNVQFQPSLITKPREDKRVVENTTVTFHCNASGNPTPKITWTKDGRTVGTGSKLTFVALRNHAGRYWCSAENGLSAGVKANVYLHVLSVPLPPINVKVSDCKDWTAELSWVPDPSDNASITHYLIEQESSENPVVFNSLLTVTSPNRTSVFLKLTKESVLRFRMKAVNSVGASRPSLTSSCKSSDTKVGARQDKETPIYYRAWFLTVLALVAYAILFALLLVLYRTFKEKGVKYNVSKRERKRGCKEEELQSEEKSDEEETHTLVVDTENTPPEEKPQEPDRRPRPTSNYSLFEVQFGEDASFTEEYGDHDEMFQHIQGTFV